MKKGLIFVVLVSITGLFGVSAAGASTTTNPILVRV